MIQIIITLNEKNAGKDLQRLNEQDLIDQDKDAINYLVKEFKKFLVDKRQPMSSTNEDCGLKITWRK